MWSYRWCNLADTASSKIFRAVEVTNTEVIWEARVTDGPLTVYVKETLSSPVWVQSRWHMVIFSFNSRHIKPELRSAIRPPLGLPFPNQTSPPLRKPAGVKGMLMASCYLVHLGRVCLWLLLVHFKCVREHSQVFKVWGKGEQTSGKITVTPNI